MSKHYEFIMSPIENIIEDATNAIELIGSGIESYPLNEYMLKSIFLKMTGFQEQKFKCIAWEMATENYKFRRKFLEDFSKEGFSSYKSKQNLYKKLIEILDRKEFSENERKEILDESRKVIEEIIGKSNICDWNQSLYLEFKKQNKSEIELDHIARLNDLLTNTIQEIYEKLYFHRNRLAHNTLSYQVNFPRLETLEQESFGDNNYIIWFYILIIIDKIMIKLYKEFYESNEDLIFD